MENTLLNLIPSSYIPEVHLSQYDAGRTIQFKLMDGNSEYSVPSGANIKILATKPSGLGFEVACTFSGNIVTLVNTETMSNESGRFRAELRITSGNVILGTSNFIMNVERSPHPEGTIDGDIDAIIPEFTLLVEEARSLVERAEESAESVVTIEPRVSANETAINVLDARMDTFASLPNGSTTGDAELIDIRVAYDGVTYPTAGDSVRGQAGEIFQIVTKGETVDEDVNYTLIEAKTINGDRNIVDVWLPYYITEPISVVAGERYELTANVNWGSMLYVFYDSNDTAFGGVRSENTDAGTSLTDEVIIIPSDAVSIRLCAYIDNQHPFSFKKVSFPNIADKLSTILSADINGKIEGLETLVTKGETAYTSFDVTLVQGKVINGDRNIINADSYYYISDVISVEEGEKYKLTASMNWGNFLYVFYDANGVGFGGVSSEYAEEWTSLNNEVITIPSNAVSMRLGVYLDNVRGYSLEKETPIVIADKLSKNVTQVWKGKKWLIIGDSLSEINVTADKKYHNIIAEATGIQVLNYAKSGTGYAKTYETSENFCDRVLTLGNVDCDVLTIFGSMNDVSLDMEVGTADDTGTTTLGGYINRTLDNLYSVKPFVQVGIMLPVPNWGKTPMGGSTTSNKAIQYCDVLKEIAEKRSIPVLDMFQRSNLHPDEANFRNEYFYNADGVHPNNKGHQKIAPMVLQFLKEIIQL